MNVAKTATIPPPAEHGDAGDTGHTVAASLAQVREPRSGRDHPKRLTDVLMLRDDRVGRACARMIEGCEAKAFARGVQLEVCTDFQALAEISSGLDKLPLTPQFDPAVSDIGPMNGFWLKGTDAGGAVVQTQAVRVDDLSDTTLARHLSSLRAFYRDPGDAPAGESCSVGAPAAHVITGRVGYHGEFWLRGGFQGYRGADLAHVLPRIGLAIALARFRPDFMYGTVQPAVAEKGLVARYGYRNVQPNGICWTRPAADGGDSDVLDEWLMWLTWRDLMDLMEHSGAS